MTETERVRVIRSKLEEEMSTKRDEQAEIEAAKERLRKFCKRASECKNYHDPERLARVKEGREHAPRGVSWAELGRRYRTM